MKTNVSKIYLNIINKNLMTFIPNDSSPIWRQIFNFMFKEIL